MPILRSIIVLDGTIRTIGVSRDIEGVTSALEES